MIGAAAEPEPVIDCTTQLCHECPLKDECDAPDEEIEGCENCDHEFVQYEEWPCRECSRNAQFVLNEHDFYFDSGFKEME